MNTGPTSHLLQKNLKEKKTRIQLIIRTSWDNNTTRNANDAKY